MKANVPMSSYAKERLVSLVSEGYTDEISLREGIYCLGELAGKTAELRRTIAKKTMVSVAALLEGCDGKTIAKWEAGNWATPPYLYKDK